MIDFIKNIELRLKKNVRRINSDNGSEFKNKTFDSFLTELGILRKFSYPYIRQRNGVVKRRNRSLCEAARTMLTYANLPQYLWAEVVLTACFTQNRFFIHRHFNITPHEILNKRKPNVKFFHGFGCRYFIMNLKDTLSKL